MPHLLFIISILLFIQYSNEADGKSMYINYKCGRAETISPILEKKYYPWYVALTASNNWTNPPECAGALIARKHILTLAHCFKEGENQYHWIHQFQIWIGVHERKDDNLPDFDKAVQRYAERVIVHPNFTNNNFLNHNNTANYDIAVIKVVLSVQEHMPICLPTFGLMELPESAKVIGLGYDEKLGRYPNKVRGVYLNLYSADLCRKYTNNQIMENYTVKNDMICGEGWPGIKYSGGEGDILQTIIANDTDDKLRHTILGLPSVGREIPDINSTTVGFTNVFYYRRWIEEVLH